MTVKVFLSVQYDTMIILLLPELSYFPLLLTKSKVVPQVFVLTLFTISET